MRDIDLSNKLINEMQAAQSVSLQKVQVLNSQIQKRNKVIRVYREEISSVEKKIAQVDSSIIEIQKDIDRLKSDYSKLLLQLYKRRNHLESLSFFFSSSSFNQAYQRYRMIGEINDYRKNQAMILVNANASLAEEKKKQVEYRQKLNLLLQEVVNQNKSISREKVVQQKYIEDLRKKEKVLLGELKENEKRAKDLENKIYELIKIESGKKVVSTSDFGKNKGKLIWPVSNGVVISEFGEHDHPVLKGVKVKNNGIDIKTSGNNTVFSVFEGEVSRVVGIPGYNKAVIIRHGKYLTVYANLETVNVKSGDKIKTGSVIGEVFDSGKGDDDYLHFEIWEENQKINPDTWLKM